MPLLSKNRKPDSMATKSKTIRTNLVREIKWLEFVGLVANAKHGKNVQTGYALTVPKEALNVVGLLDALT